ncbi:unnamed protein product [Brachionus calyciflorus]|uniref:Uncharacterized protein n=1 Tax=Brachionus calyciflorus TaxID=104777 RepID=A0A813M0V9_9BILA|nr:unnamed protein product [Brachionus calyciflorus]
MSIIASNILSIKSFQEKLKKNEDMSKHSSLKGKSGKVPIKTHSSQDDIIVLIYMPSLDDINQRLNYFYNETSEFFSSLKRK